jgi:Predicted redox protein, regulator of disulfide bond formation
MNCLYPGILTDTDLIHPVVLIFRFNTMTGHDPVETLDVKGQSCPMPVIKTKQSIDDIGTSEVLEVLATDPGSVSDIAGWATETDGVELVDQDEGTDVFTHYVRKTE